MNNVVGERSFNDSQNFISQNSRDKGQNYNEKGRGRNNYGNNRCHFYYQLCGKFNHLVNR